MKYKVLMVCSDNIIRSPLAAGLLNFAAEAKELADHLEIDSAGTNDDHAGEPPAPAILSVAASHGFALHHEAREIDEEDLAYFDEILALDEPTFKILMKKAKTPILQSKVRLITEYDPRQEKQKDIPLPSPKNPDAYEELYEQLWYCSMGFLKRAK